MFGDDFGYFIYEYSLRQPHAGLEVLAKAASYDAALRLADIYIAASARPRRESRHSTTKAGSAKKSRSKKSKLGTARSKRDKVVTELRP
jgi:hypothetical protein